jgi:integrase
MRPQTYLFPGTVNHLRADKPITEKMVWQAVREASNRAGIKKRVTPHTLRHYAEFRTMPSRRGRNVLSPIMIGLCTTPPSAELGIGLARITDL